MNSVGFSARDGSFTADNGKRKKMTEYYSAEHRLRMIEQISKYREDKIKKEFEKLEEELRIENDRQRKQHLKELKMQQYHQRQKQKLLDYQKIKQMKEMQKSEKEKQENERMIMKERMRME